MKTGHFDIVYQFGNLVRSRITVFRERRHFRIVLRLIPLNIPTLERLELASSLGRFVDMNRGMILITGPWGAGKSTTLAALVDRMNETRDISIATVEDPIEYLYQNKRGTVSQHEIGYEGSDFSSGALKSLREEPDVLVIGEMSDSRTILAAIQAVETDHLVLSTLPTRGAAQTIARLINTFPETERDMIRDQIACTLSAVVSQRLVKRIDKKGRIAALEIMIVSDRVAAMIREGRFADIQEEMKSGSEGMRTLDQALANLVKERKIRGEYGAWRETEVHAYHPGVDVAEPYGAPGWMFG